MVEVSSENAELLLQMFAKDGGEGLNTSLAIALSQMAAELGRDELITPLLMHAKEVAEDEEDRNWCRFELMKSGDSNLDELMQLGLEAETENQPKLAAAVFHHLALLQMGDDLESAEISANRAMRLRTELEDSTGLIYGHALIAAIAKAQQDWETAQTHLRKRLDMIAEEEKSQRMEAMADLAHAHATIGELQEAQNLMIESLEIAEEIDSLNGILVARWGLADLAEISENPDEAMVQLSDIMTTYMSFNTEVPAIVLKRLNMLTNSQ